MTENLPFSPCPNARRVFPAYLSLILLLLVFALLGCSSPLPASPDPATTTAPASPSLQAAPSLTPTLALPRQLTVCLPKEPASLFLYGDNSHSAGVVRSAIYDGPVERQDFSAVPVILEKLPSLADGDAVLQPVDVLPNEGMVDSLGRLANLAAGMTYLPSGCAEQSCAQTYQDGAAVQLDQLVLRFQLKTGLTWSDGLPLTAGDSVYSYDVTQALGAQGQPELVARTQSYQALDETTVEWRGLPGLRPADPSQFFFSPLPRQAWSDLAPSQLITATLSARTPPGWGAYQVAEWAPGASITLARNPNYFRAAEGLPAFDFLVYRFLPDAQQALGALQSGECDLLDPAYGFSAQDPEVLALQQAGQAALVEIPGTSWEHLDFGIAPADPQRPAIFQLKQVRQAVALCIDRQALAAEFAPGQAVLDSYLPDSHPLANRDLRRYAYEPVAGGALLQAAGWLDLDNNPATPRLAQAVPGVPDGSLLLVSYYTSDSEFRLRLAEQIKNYLAQCGFQVEITSGPGEQIFAAGPGGPVFGRNFDLAQFAWPASDQPACALYTSSQIPGPYPQFSQGWGGGNASGTSNPQFDQACLAAGNALPETPQFQAAYQQAEAIFAEELPALPLFQRASLLLARPDFCGIKIDASNPDIFWNLEQFNYGAFCL
jgi:peptide/nickel transport system substrate-binding protein